MKEQLGAVLNESDGAADSLDTLTGFIEEIGTFLKSSDGIDLVDDFARSLAGIAADAINAALGFRELYRNYKLWKDGFIAESLEEGERADQLTQIYTRLADRLQAVATGRREADGDDGGGAPTGGGGGGPRRPRRPRPPGARAGAEGPTVTVRTRIIPPPQEQQEAVLLSFRVIEDAKRDPYAAIEQQDAQFLSSTLGIATSGLSNFARAVATGSASIGEALRGMVGGIISSFGEMMIQLGSAAVLAGTLGTVAPIFAPGTGGPLGVGAGVALIAGGAAMVGIGAALGGRGGGAASTPTATPSSVGAPGRTRLPDSPFARGFEGGPGFGGAMQAAASTVVVNFNGIVDSRRAAREIRDVLGATG